MYYKLKISVEVPEGVEQSSGNSVKPYKEENVPFTVQI